MLNRIKAILSAGPASEPRTEQQRIQLATCVLLLEMAHSDGELHELEELLVRDLLQNRFALDGEAVQELIALADAERRESLDLYQFARAINDSFSREEKYQILLELWRIVYSDGVLDKYEEHLMRQLATLLRQSHREMITAKLQVLDERRDGAPS